MWGFILLTAISISIWIHTENLLRADTTSDLLSKGALAIAARSVWQGMIYVALGGQRRMVTKRIVSCIERKCPLRFDPRPGNISGRCALYTWGQRLVK